MAEAKGNISVAHIGSAGAAQTLELRLRSRSETGREGRGSRLSAAEDVESVVLSLCSGGRGPRGAAKQPGICLPAWASTCFDAHDSRRAPSPVSRPSPAALGLLALTSLRSPLQSARLRWELPARQLPRSDSTPPCPREAAAPAGQTTDVWGSSAACG